MSRILIVEDDKNTARLMQVLLEHAGYETFLAQHGLAALDYLEKIHVDLILLDVMMPEMDGYELTNHLRSQNDNTPILMVTAKQLPEERCQGFIVGTDDYMVKPVNEEELLLRIRALLRRAQIASVRKIRFANVELDYDALSVKIGNSMETLPQKEFLLLYKLLLYPNQIFTRVQLMDEIWGKDTQSLDTTLNVHINRLRTRFSDVEAFSIKAIRGVGYKAVRYDET